uniref:Uncharacterized protein n=1 Tax=Arundo donax TaxID=35708 RepID=A0A0A9D8T3_ARUDO
MRSSSFSTVHLVETHPMLHHCSLGMSRLLFYSHPVHDTHSFRCPLNQIAKIGIYCSHLKMSCHEKQHSTTQKSKPSACLHHTTAWQIP